MKDEEIYCLAGQVLGNLTHELNIGIYAKLRGTLSLKWHEGRIFGAFASSASKPADPPIHSITIYYEFVRQVWRDAEEFCEFLKNVPDGSDVDELFEVFGDRIKLPVCFSETERVTNMFVAAISWVYFHEIGHLIQEHGAIRNEFVKNDGGPGQAADVHDIQVADGSSIVGREALVSHVTELAADFEATYFYTDELLRHFVEPGFVDDENRAETFSGLIYLMVCSLSLVFLRFNGSQPILPMESVTGSHPNPLIRLEILVPQIFENLDTDIAKKLTGHELDRNELVKLCGKAAFSAMLYWCLTKTEKREIDERFLLKGILSSSVTLIYLRPIVACWDEMLPRIMITRRFGFPGGVMGFTDSFKERINNVIVWGKGAEGEVDIEI